MTMTLYEFVKKYEEIEETWRNPPEDVWFDVRAVVEAGKNRGDCFLAIARHNGFSTVEEAGMVDVSVEVGPEAEQMLLTYEENMRAAVFHGVFLHRYDDDL